MELEYELAAVFVEEALGQLAILGGPDRPRPLRIAAAQGLATAAGLIGITQIQACAESAQATLRAGEEPDAEVVELGRLLDAIPRLAPERLDSWHAESRPAGDAPVDLDTAELIEILSAFRAEAAEHLDGLTTALLDFEKDPTRRALVDELLRKTHTLKGSAATVGLTVVSEAAHALEEVLVTLRSGTLARPATFDGLHTAVDTLRALIRPDAPAEAMGHLRKQLAALTLTESVPSSADTAASSSAPSFESSHPVTIRADEDLVEERRFDRRKEDAHVVRVEAVRLDQLMDGVGELVFDRTRIERRVGELRNLMREVGKARAGLRALLHQHRIPRLAELEESIANQVAHLTRTSSALLDDANALRRTTVMLQDGLTRVRMTKIRWLFQRLARPLRDLERLEGKRVTIITSGGDTELDKAVVEKVTDPLIHLLRNALAHGIEPTEVRIAAGKPAEGTVTLAARHEGDAVFLEVADDGAGLAPERIRASLVASGRLSSAEARAATDAQLVAAIFEPGVSTRDTADELAGRGVGLDVVRENIARLGGEITVTSAPGRGTRFSLRLPLTTAITQAFLFKVAGQVYALPNVHIVEATTLDTSSPTLPTRVPGHDQVPLLSLHRIFGVEGPADARCMPVLVLEFAGRRLAATCDKIIGPREIVVKSLGPMLAPLELYAGATISGSGKVQLILDPAALVEIAYSTDPPIAPAESASFQPIAIAAEPQLPERRPRILLADDSRTVRESLARMLASEGYVVDLAADGQEAWNMLHETRYDLLVTDIEMPRLGGAELIERLRTAPTFAQLAIVAISSRAPETAGRFDVFISKPVPRQVLARELERLLRR